MPTGPDLTGTIAPVPIRPRRQITGISAILLPFAADGSIDQVAFQSHIERTLAAGLTPAVNMDTGYANLLDEATRVDLLRQTREVATGRDYVAGAYVGDSPDANFDETAYAREVDHIQTHGGRPVIFQSFGLTQGADDEIVDRYHTIANHCDQFIAFELGQMFAPFGSIYSMDVYEALMGIPNCTGAKHSSLQRQLEWERLALRDRVRPDFKVFTGNDLAIDMVMYGSDYLLGLSTFAPDAFAQRDAMWAAGDPAFYELNDVLQYLGFFAFRDPVPAYKHTAAMFLKLRDWIATDATHPQSPTRPASDLEVLKQLLIMLTKV